METDRTLMNENEIVSFHVRQKKMKLCEYEVKVNHDFI